MAPSFCERQILVVLVLVLGWSAPAAFADEPKLLWGDTHLHSSNSFDAYLNRNGSADPDTAYRFAKGLPVVHPYNRARVQIGVPLDFLVVADHAEYMGVIRHVVERGIPREDLGLGARIRARLTERSLRKVIREDTGSETFRALLPKQGSVEAAAANPPQSRIPAAAKMARTVWHETIETADAHNEPGVFTALIGWEWSSVPAGANLHRVVFTSADAEVASQFQPFASTDSMYPGDLWGWLAETAERTGAEFVAIPHNSNISKGYMFPEKSLRGVPMTPEYARMRAEWEPVVEATQIKGDSETHPDLSPDDPFADFETYTHYIQQDPQAYRATAGDYVRSGLLRGLAIEQQIGFNPYRFGLIGSTDAHTGLASAEEPNFWGKMARDSVPENKSSPRRGPGGATGWSMAAQGLAAVWAEANTRSAILEAFRRKQVYATTGPRIVVRFFGGWDFGPADAAAADFAARGAARGVPMGGALPPAPAHASGAPRFLVHAGMDPMGAHLDRVQIVKGWVDAEGGSHEHVFDVVWSGDRQPGADGVLPEVGNTVDPERASYSNEIGSPELSSVWQDPDFDPTRPAFYYLRVLEIPTPRHSTLDAVALGLDPRKLELDRPWWIQERGYTSPIWYRPLP